MELLSNGVQKLENSDAPTNDCSSFNVDDLIEYSPEDAFAYLEQNQRADDLLQCLKCGQKFGSKTELRRHGTVKHADWPLVSAKTSEAIEQVVYVCSLCFRQYELQEDLRGHMIEFHKYETAKVQHKIKEPVAENDVTINTQNTNQEAPAQKSRAENAAPAGSKGAALLEMRPLPFKDFRLLLRIHMQLRCSVSPTCIHKFQTAAQLEAHARCHAGATNESKNKFHCCDCAAEFPNWRSCSAHMWKAHQLDVDLLHCPLCSFKAHASVLVWRHMRFHKKWRPRVLKSLRAVREKRQRLSAQQRTQEQPKPATPNTTSKNKYYAEKTCEICSRKFVNGKTLSKHVKSVHNKIKPFICNVCGKKMARKASLIIHMRQHTGEKPLQCQTCKFATRDPSVLKKHQMRHEKAGKHKCNRCDYVCIQTNVYKRHMRLNHPDEFKKISCDLCTYVTINEQRLAAHKEDHRKGLIQNVEDSQDAAGTTPFKNPTQQHGKRASNADISTDFLLPLESVDSLPHEPTVDTGGVTIPAPSEDTQFPTYLNS